ncbi:MAG TPA: peptidylprolyl isomerase [Gemmatimonadaceae bacterium]|jgi:peptidyl-prolyl cis-trans isomerase SurA|nr:peptidylprolyl isomerase [Gemmatimonadaceae bacterium]
MNRFIHKALPALAFAAIASGRSVAQLPTPPVTPPVTPAAQTGPVALDGIVAVVGDQPITRIDLRERVLGKIQRKEVAEPASAKDSATLDSATLSDMIEEELLLQKATDLKITVSDADVASLLDRQIRETRSRFQTETEYRNALQQAGLGTPEEYRKYLLEQYRRRYTLERTVSKLKQDGKIVPLNVTDAEVAAEFDKSKDYLPPKPPTVTFRQIVLAPQASPKAKEAAKLKADSVLAELKAGADFEKLARRESMHLQSKELGGDLGWARRGDNVPEFDRWLFGTPFQAPLAPGQLSPVFETPLGFHIVRVDRVQPGEVKSHQILIMPKIDSADFARASRLADSVAKLWANGTPFDSLARKYHDYAGKEETSLLTPWVRDSLPPSYQKGFANKKANDITTFQIPGSAFRPDVPKYVVAQLLTADEGGAQTLGELKAAIRSELAQRGGVRRYVDALRRQTYVSIRLHSVPTTAAKPND